MYMCMYGEVKHMSSHHYFNLKNSPMLHRTHTVQNLPAYKLLVHSSGSCLSIHAYGLDINMDAYLKAIECKT